MAHILNVVGEPSAARAHALAASVREEVSKLPPKKDAKHTLKSQAAVAMQEHNKHDEAPTNSATVRALSAPIRSATAYENWVLYNPHAPCRPCNYEQMEQVPATTTTPCFHCHRTFTTTPVVALVPHTDNQRASTSKCFWGNWCSGPCMIGYFVERNSSQELAWAHQACALQGMSTPQPAAPPSFSLTSFGGPCSVPTGETAETATRTFRGRWIPATIAFNTTARSDSGGVPIASMVFANTGGNPHGLSVPRGASKPPLLQTSRTKQQSALDQFEARLMAGEDADNITLSGVGGGRSSTGIRRSKIVAHTKAAPADDGTVL